MTIKQKLALKEITENNRSVSSAMRAVGYSPQTATKPSNLTNSKGFKELLKEKLDDELLLSKHKEALEATKWNDFTGDRESDHTTRLKAVELGYKLKKYLSPETFGQLNVGDLQINVVNYAQNNNTV